jgi:hypothetical protein
MPARITRTLRNPADVDTGNSQHQGTLCCRDRTAQCVDCPYLTGLMTSLLSLKYQGRRAVGQSTAGKAPQQSGSPALPRQPLCRSKSTRLCDMPLTVRAGLTFPPGCRQSSRT